MDWFTQNSSYVLNAFWLTVRLSVYSGVISFCLGTVLAVLSISAVPVMRLTARAYVLVFRNTPLTLILFFCSFGLWQNLGVSFSDTITTNNMWLAVTGLSAYTAAFSCEAIRSGINTVPPGQVEAGRALGLSFGKIVQRIILPQATRRVVGPLGSVYSAMIKNTTVAAAIGVGESALVMKEMIEDYGNEVISVFVGFSLGFVILTLPLGLLSSRLATRWMVST